MQKHQDELVHARAMRADILAAPQVWIPRREIVLEWLNGFILRAAGARYVLEETETADLRALDQFLRKQAVPAA
jgi:hypothetical protein